MPKYGDLILWEGITFRFHEEVQVEWPIVLWLCELVDESISLFDDRIRWAHSHDGYFQIPPDECEVISPDDERFVAYGDGI